MGYESRIFVVERRVGKFPNGVSYADSYKIADIKMCKMGYDFPKIFTKEIDYDLYIDSHDGARDTDYYGKKLKYTDVKTVIAYIEGMIAGGDDYRRLPLLLGLLKGIDESQWEEIQIVHFGY